MASVKLNRDLVVTLLSRSKMRPVDLARRLRISKQLVNWILHHGGLTWAPALAQIFDCKAADLLMGTPQREGKGRLIGRRPRLLTKEERKSKCGRKPLWRPQKDTPPSRRPPAK